MQWCREWLPLKSGTDYRTFIRIWECLFDNSTYECDGNDSDDWNAQFNKQWIIKLSFKVADKLKYGSKILCLENQLFPCYAKLLGISSTLRLVVKLSRPNLTPPLFEPTDWDQRDRTGCLHVFYRESTVICLLFLHSKAEQSAITLSHSVFWPLTGRLRLSFFIWDLPP